MPKPSSILLGTLEAVRHAKVSGNGLEVTMQGSKAQRIAMCYMFTISHLLSEGNIGLAGQKPEKAFGDMGQTRVNISTNAGTLSIDSYDSENTTILRVPVAPNTASITRINIERAVQKLRDVVVDQLQNVTATMRLKDDTTDYHALPASTPMDAYIMRYALAHLGAGYGHNEGVHSLMEGFETSRGKVPLVLVSPAVRNAILAGEKTPDLPMHG